MIIDEDILIKYLDGALSEDERTQVDDWAAESPENAKLLEQVYFTLQVTDRLRVMNTVDPEMALIRFKSRVRRQKKQVSLHRFYQSLQRVAAVLFIPVLVLSAYLFIQMGKERVRMVEVHTNPGVVSIFDLPDGSKVWLNAGSSLKYPENFWSECRHVELTGQGYFEVAKNPEKPFIVQVDPTYSVQVLGTRFDVSAYKDDDIVSTTLVEGSVQLNISPASGKVIHQILKPDEKAELVRGSGKLSITSVNTCNDVAWRNGEIIFKNTPMDQVLKTLQRHYNAKFNVKDPEVLSAIITARFKNEQLPQVMEYIRLASDIKFKIDKPIITSDNRLEMSVIEISKE